MSFNVTGKSPQAVVSQWMGKLGDVAGTEAGRAAGELLGQILGSAFVAEGRSPEPLGMRLDQRFPSPMQQFGQKLGALGVSAQTVGEVMNALSKLLSGRRGLKNVKRLPRPGAEAAREAADLDAAQEAADLIDTLLRAAEDARNSQSFPRG